MAGKHVAEKAKYDWRGRVQWYRHYLRYRTKCVAWRVIARWLDK